MGAAAVALAILACANPRTDRSPSDAAQAAQRARALLETGRDHAAEVEARALLRSQREAGVEDLVTARAADVLVEALLHQERGGGAEALEAARLAVAVRESLARDDAGDLAASLTNLAAVLRARSHLAAAAHHYEGLVAERERVYGTIHPGVATALAALAGAERDLGETERARASFARAAALSMPGPEAALLASRRALLDAQLGDTGAAGRACARACSLLESAHAGDPVRLGAALLTMASDVLRHGDPEAAHACAERALAVFETALGPEHEYVAAASERLGAVELARGDMRRAASNYDRAAAIRGAREAVTSAEQAAAAIARARVAAALGHGKEARQRYRTALQQRAAATASDSLRREAALRVAAALEAAGDPELAWLVWDSVDAPSDLTTGSETMRLVNALVQLAESRARATAWGEAIDAAAMAQSAWCRSLWTSAPTLSEQHLLRLTAATTGALDLATALLARVRDPVRTRLVFDTWIHSRDVVLGEMTERRRTIFKTESTVIARLEREFSDAATAHAQERVRELAGAQADPGLRRAREEREAELAMRAAAVRPARLDGDVGFDAAARALPAGAVLIAYARHHASGPAGAPSARYVAFVQQAGTVAPRFVVLGDAAEIEAAVAAWTRRVSVLPHAGDTDAGARLRADGDRLRRLVWDPVAAMTRGANLVFVVPDAALGSVSFAALPAAAGAYLVQQGFAIQYASTERDLVQQHVVRREGAGLLALGGPDYEALPVAKRTEPGTAFRGRRLECEAFDAMRFAPLPAARREARDVARIWGEFGAGKKEGRGQIALLSDAAATEAALKRDIAGRDCVHIATHGFFLGSSCGVAVDGTRGLGRMPEAAVGPLAATAASPLQLSGLALAGANRRQEGGEDGILTAEEIATLDLETASWVVLSACDTGLGAGDARGEIAGLRRAFQVAGARTLVTSLWAVEDEAARSWMRALYEARFRHRLGTAEAVRVAMLEALAARRAAGSDTHPFYWAGFVASGDWR